jgi:hypothetical protein
MGLPYARLAHLVESRFLAKIASQDRKHYRDKEIAKEARLKKLPYGCRGDYNPPKQVTLSNPAT